MRGAGPLLTAGETMALLDPDGDALPGPGTAFTLRFAGAESNFAVALARLGIPVAGSPDSVATPSAT